MTIRRSVDEMTATPDELTARVLVDWYKNIVGSKMDLNTDEADYVDARWAHLVNELSKQMEVPVGWLSWSLSQLAQAEMQAALLASLEAQQSVVSGDEEE